MANCHEIFNKYNSVIKLSDQDRNKLKSSRNELRERIRTECQKTLTQDNELKFQTQGSYIMDTVINSIDEDFDIDDGVYFIGNINQNERFGLEQKFHNLIIEAIDKNKVREEIIDKPTCVRVKYFKKNGDDLGFHIDLPIYYKEGTKTPELANTRKKWTNSDPVLFIEWFELKARSDFEKSYLLEYEVNKEKYSVWSNDIRKKDVQLRRIVRYLKAWGDFRKKEMPSGIMMTILGAENFSSDERDDIALRDTLLRIRNFLAQNGFKCPRPTIPIGEDLFSDLSQGEKDYFKNALDSLIESANKAIEFDTQIEACKEWKKHFGERFPCQLASEHIKSKVTHQPKIESLKSTIVNKPWSPKN